MSYSEGSRDRAETPVRENAVPWYLDPASGVKLLILLFAGVGLFMTTLATFGGANRFLTDQSQPEYYVPVGMTALLVGVLAFSSVLVSEKFTFRKPVSSISVLVLYIAAVAICWIFSFSTYYAQFNSRTGSDLASTENALANFQAVTLPLEKVLVLKINDAKTGISKNADFGNFTKSMAEFAQVLDGNEHKTATKLINDKKAEENDNRENAAKMQQALDLESAKNASDDLQKKRDTISDEIDKAGIEVENAGGRIKNLERAVAFENPPEFQGGSLPKPAPKVAQADLAASLVGEPCSLSVREIGKGKCLTALNNALEAERKKESGASALKRSKSSELALIKIEIDAALEKLDALEGKGQSGQTAESSLKTTDTEQGLGVLLVALTDEPSLKRLNQVVARCEAGKKEYAQLKLSLPAVGDCRPAAVSALIGSLDQAVESRNNLAQVCSGNSKAIEVIENLRNALKPTVEEGKRLAAQVAAFDAMRQKVIDPCLAAADASGIPTVDVRKDAKAFIDTNNPSQDEIGKASGKVIELFNGQASPRDYFPAGLALAQELSLLLAKIAWGAVGSTARARRPEESDYSDIDLSPDANDTANVAAAKNLLRVSGIDVDGLLAPVNFDGEDVKDDMRTQMKFLLNRLVASGSASRNRRGFSISQAGVAEIVGTIRKHQSGLIQQEVREVRTPEKSFSSGREYTAPNNRPTQTTQAMPEAATEIEIGKMRNGDAKPEMPREVRPLIDPYPYE